MDSIETRFQIPRVFSNAEGFDLVGASSVRI